MSTDSKSKRINVSLPTDTLVLIDKVGSGNRSAFIDEAVRSYATRLSKARIKRQLKKAYLQRAEEDRAYAEDGEHLSLEVLEHLELQDPNQS